MPNGLQTKIEFKETTNNAQAVVWFMHQSAAKNASNSGGGWAKEVAELTAAGLVDGKLGSASIHLAAGAMPTRLIVIGLGEEEKHSIENLRMAGSALAKLVAKHAFETIAFLDTPGAAEIVYGFILGGFEFTDYKGTATKEKVQTKSTTLRLVEKITAAQRSEIERAFVIAQSQNYARTIASRPGNDINPPSLAKVAQELARDLKLGFTVLDEKKMKQMQMGGMIGVGAGSSATPPRMIVLEYNGAGAKNKKTPLLVVGKAITFDTGGISIKGASGMEWMVFDKCGGMAVLGMMRAVALLKLPVRVVGILAAAENHISETAYRPGDILKMYNGVTVEVISTDAEGRLVLADALAWGIEKYKPAAVVDIATLTGGVVVALGKSMAGVMGNNDPLIEQLQAASKAAGEKIWELPVFDEHRELLKSKSADICNSGPREATPLIGGAFLSHFVPPNTPWAHLDIAGVAWAENAKGCFRKGATGWGVGTLVQWVKSQSNSR